MNIKEIITKLNSIQVDDLKNIDMDQIKDYLRTQPNALIIAGLILITLFGISKILSTHQQKASVLNTQKNELTEKLNVQNKFTELEQEYQQLINNFPESIPSFQIIDKISEFAVVQDVQILSFSPAKEEDEEYWELATVNINVASEKYKNILYFMQAIENSPYAIRIKRWSGKLQEDNARSFKRDEEKKKEKLLIEASIDIESIKLNNE